MILNNLEQIMRERGITAGDLQERTGLAFDTICRLRDEPRSSMSLATLDRLCRGLGVQPGELLSWFANDAPEIRVNLREYLRSLGLEVVDHRLANGNLWVVGGPELADTLKGIEEHGPRFTFTAYGGSASDHRPAWYTSWRDS